MFILRELVSEIMAAAKDDHKLGGGGGGGADEFVQEPVAALDEGGEIDARAAGGVLHGDGKTQRRGFGHDAEKAGFVGGLRYLLDGVEQNFFVSQRFQISVRIECACQAAGFRWLEDEGVQLFGGAGLQQVFQGGAGVGFGTAGRKILGYARNGFSIEHGFADGGGTGGGIGAGY
ncbi:MAG: hypothetical protein JWL81_2064 [Verrucomicrobiales bacterium]|nr:hypothetical protein [Verrucomicrobiales bacterium]